MVNERLNRDRPIFARVKYLCDYGPDNCNPVCLDVNYEEPNVMMSVSLFFQRAQEWPFYKTIEHPQELCCLILNVPVQYQLSSIIASSWEIMGS